MTDQTFINSMESVAQNAYLTIQPVGSEVFIVQNLYFEGDMELYLTDGTNSFLIESETSENRLEGTWYLTSDHYLKIKNKEATAKLLSYDGVSL